MIRSIFIALFAIALLHVTISAQSDVPGSKDHPLPTRLTYRMKENAKQVSMLQIIRNYEQVLAKIKTAILYREDRVPGARTAGWGSWRRASKQPVSVRTARSHQTQLKTGRQRTAALIWWSSSSTLPDQHHTTHCRRCACSHPAEVDPAGELTCIPRQPVAPRSLFVVHQLRAFPPQEIIHGNPHPD